MVNNKKFRVDAISNGKNASEEDSAAACQTLLQKKSDIKTQIEALQKAGDEGAIRQNLEDAEQRLADARVNSVVDKSSKMVSHHKKNRNQTTSKRHLMVKTKITHKIHEMGLDHSQ